MRIPFADTPFYYLTTADSHALPNRTTRSGSTQATLRVVVHFDVVAAGSTYDRCGDFGRNAGWQSGRYDRSDSIAPSIRERQKG